MYIVIENKGLVPVEAFTLMGASDKRGKDDKIGYFGSGNKYALAWLARNNSLPYIFSGLEQIVVGTVTKPFKDKTFEIITFNGKETSITSEMGPKWQAWYVFREFISNALDEGEMQVFSTEDVKPVEGKTRIFLSAEKFNQIWNTKHKYFKFWSKHLAEVDKWDKVPEDIYNTAVRFYRPIVKNRTNIYRKGILVMERDIASIFDYNLNEAEINESRELSSDYQARYAIGSAMLRLTDKKLIEDILVEASNDKLYESQLMMNSFAEPSDEWIEVLSSFGKVVVPNSAAPYYKGKFEGLIQVWDWLFEAVKHKLKAFNLTTESDFINEEEDKSYDHEVVFKLFGKFGFRVKQVKRADIINGRSILIRQGVMYISKQQKEETSELELLKIYASQQFGVSSFIDHLMSTST